jgi:hypothetical protein
MIGYAAKADRLRARQLTERARSLREALPPTALVLRGALAGLAAALDAQQRRWLRAPDRRLLNEYEQRLAGFATLAAGLTEIAAGAQRCLDAEAELRARLDAHNDQALARWFAARSERRRAEINGLASDIEAVQQLVAARGSCTRLAADRDGDVLLLGAFDEAVQRAGVGFESVPSAALRDALPRLTAQLLAARERPKPLVKELVELLNDARALDKLPPPRELDQVYGLLFEMEQWLAALGGAPQQGAAVAAADIDRLQQRLDELTGRYTRITDAWRRQPAHLFDELLTDAEALSNDVLGTVEKQRRALAEALEKGLELFTRFADTDTEPGLADDVRGLLATTPAAHGELRVWRDRSLRARERLDRALAGDINGIVDRCQTQLQALRDQVEDLATRLLGGLHRQRHLALQIELESLSARLERDTADPKAPRLFALHQQLETLSAAFTELHEQCVAASRRLRQRGDCLAQRSQRMCMLAERLALPQPDLAWLAALGIALPDAAHAPAFTIPATSDNDADARARSLRQARARLVREERVLGTRAAATLAERQRRLVGQCALLDTDLALDLALDGAGSAAPARHAPAALLHALERLETVEQGLMQRLSVQAERLQEHARGLTAELTRLVQTPRTADEQAEIAALLATLETASTGSAPAAVAPLRSALESAEALLERIDGPRRRMKRRSAQLMERWGTLRHACFEIAANDSPVHPLWERARSLLAPVPSVAVGLKTWSAQLDEAEALLSALARQGRLVAADRLVAAVATLTRIGAPVPAELACVSPGATAIRMGGEMPVDLPSAGLRRRVYALLEQWGAGA